MTRAVVMEGSLEEFDLMSVVQTVSIGRQYTGVDLLDDMGSLVGTMFVKAGHIVAATSEGLSGFEAVRRLVRTRRLRRFFVYRSKMSEAAARPVGPVGEVLMKVVSSDGEREEQRGILLEGSLREHSLSTVLEVTTLGRRCVGVDLFDVDGRKTGSVCVKSGQVLTASRGRLTGKSAVRSLLESTMDGRFVAYRAALPAEVTPIGSVRELLSSDDVDVDYYDDLIIDAEDIEEVTEVGRPKSQAADRTAADSVLPAAHAPAHPEVTAPLYRVPRPSSAVPAELRDVPLVAAPPPPALRESPSIAPRFRKSEPRSAAPSAPPAFVDVRASSEASLPQAKKLAPVVCVTSPKGGAGKTTIALNLSVALARRKQRVALVDADQNGILPALNASERGGVGVLDALTARVRIEDAMLATRVPGLHVLPSGRSATDEEPSAADWERTLHALRTQHDVVLVDCPPSLHGQTRQVAAAATHALVVLPADPAALRVAAQHEAMLDAASNGRLEVLGVVLNMLDYQAGPSLRVLEELCSGPQARHLFDVTIPRSPAFMEATALGVPICHGELQSAPTIAWVFHSLASAVLERLGLLVPCVALEPLL